MSIRNLKATIFAMNKTEEFSFPHHLKDGKFSLEDTLAKLEIVETQHFPTKPSMASIGTNFCHAVQERYGSHIIDMAKELIYRHGIPEETICDAISLACVNENIVLEPKQAFLSGTPSLPRGCTGDGNAKVVEDIKRHYASFKSMKNKPETRLARKRSILSLLRVAQYNQEKLLGVILSPGAIDILGESSTGWKDFSALLKDTHNEITNKQNEQIKAIKGMANTMKEMHEKPAVDKEEKPIHFLGVDHYQAVVAAPTATAIQAQRYVQKMIDTLYPDDHLRKHAYQTVMSYIHRLPAEYQKSIIRLFNITETDPRQVGIQITQILEEKIKGKKPSTPAVEIEFDKKLLGYAFNKDNPILTDPEKAVRSFFESFQSKITSHAQILSTIEAICGFFKMATDEVKHEVITRVYRIHYFGTDPKQLGSTIVSMSKQWFERNLNMNLEKAETEYGNRNMFNLQGSNMNPSTAPTAAIIPGDYPEMADELERMFSSLGMSVVRPMMGGYNHSASAPSPQPETPESNIDKAIVSLVDSWMVLRGIDKTSAMYSNLRAQLILKAFEQYKQKPKLKTETICQKTIDSFKLFDANNNLSGIIHMTYEGVDQKAVVTFQYPSGSGGVMVAGFKLHKKGADQVFAYVRECCESDVQYLHRAIHHKVHELGGTVLG